MESLKTTNEQELPAVHPTPKEQLEKVWTTVLKHNGSTKGREESEAKATDLEREWPSYDILLSDLTNSDYNETLQCPHDLRFLGSGRGKKRALCPHGVVCCARLELFPAPGKLKHNYTGLLSPGVTIEHCIMRLSSAMKPPNDEVQSRVGRALLYAAGKKLRNAKLFPTAALKVFRDGGEQSGNLLFGGCKVGQHEEDFFAHCLCTQLTERMPRTVKPFVRKFWQYSDYPLSLGVSEFCSQTQNGSKVEGDVEFPFALVLSPCKRESDNRTSTTSARNTPDPPRGQPSMWQFTKAKPKTTSTEATADSFESFDTFLDDVLAIPVGTTLYNVFACPNPESVPDPSKLQRIGRIVTSSEMIQSGSDDGLFFRHQQKEEDYELRPEWKESIKTQCSVSNGEFVGAVSKLAGWELFEQHIEKGSYVDFEALAETRD